MIAYTGIETVSNLAEEVRDPARNVPARVQARRRSRSSRSTSRCRRSRSRRCRSSDDRRRVRRRCSALPPEEGGFANDPVLGVVENLGPHGRAARRARDLRRRPRRDDPLHRDERRRDRRVADHVRDGDATGSCPSVFRRLHSALQDAVARARRLRRGRRRSSSSCPGRRLPRDDVLVRRDALVHDRARLARRAALPATRTRSSPSAARPNLRVARGRLAAVRAPRRARHRDRVARRRRPDAGDALGGPRLARARASSSTRSTAAASCALPLRGDRARAGARLGPSLDARVPDDPRPGRRGRRSRRRRSIAAARLAAERGATIVVRARARGAARAARSTADLARAEDARRRAARRRAGAARERTASGSSRGSSARAAPAARSSTRRRARNAELIVVGAPRRRLRGGAPIFGGTVDYVLKRAPCRVLVVAGRKAAAA